MWWLSNHRQRVRKDIPNQSPKYEANQLPHLSRIWCNLGEKLQCGVPSHATPADSPLPQDELDSQLIQFRSGLCSVDDRLKIPAIGKYNERIQTLEPKNVESASPDILQHSIETLNPENPLARATGSKKAHRWKGRAVPKQWVDSKFRSVVQKGEIQIRA